MKAKPVNEESFKNRRDSCQLNQKKNYHKGTKKLPDLRNGDIVRVTHNGEWIPAIVDQKLEKPRRFIVKTNYGGKVQRNRRHLLKTNESYNDLEEVEDDFEDAKPDTQSVEEEEEHLTREENAQLVDEHSDNENVYYTRSDRRSIPPARYNDFVVYR